MNIVRRIARWNYGASIAASAIAASTFAVAIAAVVAAASIFSFTTIAAACGIVVFIRRRHGNSYLEETAKVVRRRYPFFIAQCFFAIDGVNPILAVRV